MSFDYKNYTKLVEVRPFGWELDNPPSVPYYDWELLDPFYWYKFFEDYWQLSYYVGAAYVLTIFGIQAYMKNKPAYELKGPLFCWNMALGIFSIVGFVRSSPDFFQVINQPNGFYKSICLKKGINVPSAFWAMMFAFSKYVELGDTVFIVLRKRPLIFLQWYHHLVTLWVVWTVAPLVEPIARWYGVLNFGIHSIMYPYFALKTIGVRISRRVSNVITTLQLAQMIIGFTVNMISLYLQQNGYDCVRYPVSIWAFKIVYGSFTILFGKLFYDSVVKCQRFRKEKLLKDE